MITKRDLESLVDDLKRITGDDNFKLDWAYGGVRLVKVVNKYGVETDISPRLSKRGLYEWIYAFKKGIIYAHRKFCEQIENPVV